MKYVHFVGPIHRVIKDEHTSKGGIRTCRKKIVDNNFKTVFSQSFYYR